MTSGDLVPPRRAACAPGRAPASRFRWLAGAVSLALVGCGAAGTAEVPAGAGQAERTRVVLLHDNDTHFHDNHRQEVLAFIEGIRASGAQVFLVSGGDIVVRHEHGWEDGGIEYYRSQGLRMFERMNELGYDVAVPGNHELYVHGEATREILRTAEFPMVVANIRVDTERLPDFEPYHVLHADDGRTLAVLGLSVVNWEPAEGVVEEDYHATVERYRHLADEHDALIILSHIGIRYEIELANAFPEIAAVIGGHTHTLLPEAILVNGVLVAQAGGHPHERDETSEMFLGVAVLEFEGAELVDRCGWVVRIGPSGVRPAGAYSGPGVTGWDAAVPSCSGASGG